MADDRLSAYDIELLTAILATIISAGRDYPVLTAVREAREILSLTLDKVTEPEAK